MHRGMLSLTGSWESFVLIAYVEIWNRNLIWNRGLSILILQQNTSFPYAVKEVKNEREKVSGGANTLPSYPTARGREKVGVFVLETRLCDLSCAMPHPPLWSLLGWAEGEHLFMEVWDMLAEGGLVSIFWQERRWYLLVPKTNRCK